MKVKNVTKKILGQKGGITCRDKYGPEYYSKMAKRAHAHRKKLLKELSK